MALMVASTILPPDSLSVSAYGVLDGDKVEFTSISMPDGE
jgi:hypothetical protein